MYMFLEDPMQKLYLLSKCNRGLPSALYQLGSHQFTFSVQRFNESTPDATDKNGGKN